jgi:hypothetical protein
MHVVSYGQAVGLLQPVIAPLFQAMEAGLAAASEDHAARRFRRDDDPWFYGHAVRRVAIEHLRGMGLQAEAESGQPVHAMSGLLVFHRGLAVRVLRSPVTRTGRLEVPVPGHSYARQQFWRQEAGSAIPGMEADNLLLVWKDTDGILDEPMLLARPLGGDHQRGTLRLDWQGRLERSMAGRRVEDLTELEPDVEYRSLGDLGA